MVRILRYNACFNYYKVFLQSLSTVFIISVLFPVLLYRVLMSLRVNK